MSKVISLTWVIFSDTAGGFIADTNFGNYCVWQNGAGALSYATFAREKIQHNNINDAKLYCQADFEKRVLENVLTP